MKKFYRIFIAVLLVFLCCIRSLYSQTSDSEVFQRAYDEYTYYVTLGKYSEAVPYAKQAYELGIKRYGEENKYCATLAYNYGYGLVKTSHFKKAKQVLEKALNIYEKVYGDTSLELVNPLMALAEVNWRLNNPGKQYADFRRAYKIVKREKGGNSILYAKIALEYGSELFLSQTFRSKYYLDQAYKIFKQNPGSDILTGQAAFSLGRYDMAVNANSKAEKYFTESLDLYNKSRGNTDKYKIMSHAFLMELYEKLKEHDKAMEHYRAIGRLRPSSKSMQEYMPLYEPIPVYPKTALARGIEGFVIVEFSIDAGGTVVDSRVVKARPSNVFNKAALVAVKKFRFIPRYVDGKPVSTKGVRQKIEFKVDY